MNKPKVSRSSHSKIRQVPSLGVHKNYIPFVEQVEKTEWFMKSFEEYCKNPPEPLPYTKSESV